MATVIGTRGSRLALVQANWAAEALRQIGHTPEIRIIKTKGDVVHDRFDKMEGKGFFTKEIEEALLCGDIDVAVHSLKDLPTADAPGLKVSAIPEREDPLDILVTEKPLAMKDLGPDLNGLRIGTSSNRRVAGLRQHAPDAEFLPIRGNVPRRIEKMRQGEVDVVVLAQAGIKRLSLELPGLYVFPLRPEFLTPAPGQGALALQVRADDGPDLSALTHGETANCVNAERAVLAHLEGGCQLPLGVLVQPGDQGYRMRLFLQPKQGREAVRLDLTAGDTRQLVAQAIERLDRAIDENLPDTN